MGWPVPPSLPCLGLPTMGWPSSGAPRVYLEAVGWPGPPGRLPTWGGSVGWPGNRPARGLPTMGWPGWGVLSTRGPMGWPGVPLVPDNSLGGSLCPKWVKNTLGRSLCPKWVKNTLRCSLHPGKLDSGLVTSMTSDRWTTKTARVEHRLPPKQQVGGTRRGVTGVARRGTRGTKAATRRQSNSPRNSPSGKMRPTSKHRQRMRTWETRTQDGTWTDSTTCRFPPFLAPLYKTLMHYLLINNLL